MTVDSGLVKYQLYVGVGLTASGTDGSLQAMKALSRNPNVAVHCRRRCGQRGGHNPSTEDIDRATLCTGSSSSSSRSNRSAVPRGNGQCIHSRSMPAIRVSTALPLGLMSPWAVGQCPPTGDAQRMDQGSNGLSEARECTSSSLNLLGGCELADVRKQ